MNRERILKLNEMLKASCAAELEVREGDTRVRIRRMPPAPPTPPCGTEAVGESAAAAGVDPLRDATMVTAHMVGLFHRAPAPGSPPFVSKGDRIRKGDVLYIVEAMKMMNEITADADGEVVDVCAQNGQVVEFGQILFKLY